VQVVKAIPIFRIFDYQKALEFYIEWLEFTIDWEHRFEPDLPVYMQVSKNGLVLHLSEHHGDATPGSKVFIQCSGVKAYQEKLLQKQYRNYRPGLNETFYGTWELHVVDPFGNHLSFNEEKAPTG
jgi:uncharacterized glyoxalase superfamily protein PhnB